MKTLAWLIVYFGAYVGLMFIATLLKIRLNASLFLLIGIPSALMADEITSRMK